MHLPQLRSSIEVGAPTTRHVALGTAGHIDHGKTSLVKRLTGIDTDRLPEERRRGITIVLGFAPLTLADGTCVGVIDVPGHEKLVKTMVAGDGVLDVVLVVVAADEGVMPQTKEHLEICQLLGVPRAIVAMTKIDRASPDLVEMALEDVRAHLAGTSLEGAPIIPCSSVTGEGIEALLKEISRVALEVTRTPDERPFALPIDRVFSVKGFGSVVTGTLRQGALAIGDKVEVVPPVPGHVLEGPARVRSIEVFRAAVDRAVAGDRTAINLQGVDLASLTPGQIVAPVGAVAATRVADVELFHLASRTKVVKTGAKVTLHAGTAAGDASITLLDADALEPGQRGFARLRLKKPMALVSGQRFIVRGFDTTGRTLGGGVVLDPEPPRRRRHDPAVIELLSALRDGKDAAPTLLAERGARGITRASLARRLGLPINAIDRLISKKTIVIGDLLVDNDAVIALGPRLLALIDAFHVEHPFRGAVPLAQVASKIGRRASALVVERALRSLVGMKKLAQDPEGFRRPDHAPSAFTGGDARAAVLEAYESRGLEPPSILEVAAETKLADKSLRELMSVMSKNGELVRVTPELYFGKKSFLSASEKVSAFFATSEEMSAQDAKTLLGLSRKYLIPLLEALDKTGVTVRVGEVRKARAKR